MIFSILLSIFSDNGAALSFRLLRGVKGLARIKENSSEQATPLGS
jgi:hypothetical protein